jgi:hypothetical protein
MNLAIVSYFLNNPVAFPINRSTIRSGNIVGTTQSENHLGTTVYRVLGFLNSKICTNRCPKTSAGSAFASARFTNNFWKSWARNHSLQISPIPWQKAWPKSPS